MKELLRFSRSICNAFDPFFFVEQEIARSQFKDNSIFNSYPKQTLIIDSNVLRANDTQTLRKYFCILNQNYDIILPFVVVQELKEFYDNSIFSDKLGYILENTSEIHPHLAFYNEAQKYNLHSADSLILSIAKMYNSILISADLQLFEAAHLYGVKIYRSLQELLRDNYEPKYN